MSFLKSLDIAGSALTAQRQRMDIITQNIVNQQTTRTSDGGPYTRKLVVFEEINLFEQTMNGIQQKGGVRIKEIVESQKPFVPVYNPNHPDADEAGYVMMPNVDNSEEQMDLLAATRAYEANLSALSITKAMAMKTLEIGK